MVHMLQGYFTIEAGGVKKTYKNNITSYGYGLLLDSIMGAQVEWAGSLAIGIGEKANTTKQLKTNNFIMATDDSLQMEVARQAVNVTLFAMKMGLKCLVLNTLPTSSLTIKLKYTKLAFSLTGMLKLARGVGLLVHLMKKQQTEYFSLARLGNDFQSSGTATSHWSR